MSIDDQIRWRTIGEKSDADWKVSYDRFHSDAPHHVITIPPHAEAVPDHAPLTVMSATGGFYVLHLYMGDLRRLLALQPGANP